MFWHGSNFATKIVQFCTYVITKTSVFGLSSVFVNLATGYSGVSFTMDTFFALYSVNLTFSGFYIWFEQTQSFGRHYKDESGMKFPMAKLYRHQRDKIIKRFLPTFVMYGGISYYAGFVCAFGPLMGFQ